MTTPAVELAAKVISRGWGWQASFRTDLPLLPASSRTQVTLQPSGVYGGFVIYGVEFPLLVPNAVRFYLSHPQIGTYSPFLDGSPLDLWLYVHRGTPLVYTVENLTDLPGWFTLQFRKINFHRLEYMWQVRRALERESGLPENLLPTFVERPLK